MATGIIRRYAPLLIIPLVFFGQKPRLTVRVITHKRTHLDEVVAIYCVLLYYRSRGIPIKLEFIFTGVNDRSDVREDLRNSKPGVEVFWLGVGGGELDEHGYPELGIKAKEGECSATLTAKKLGLYNDPTLRPLLDWALQDDTGGCKAIQTPYYRPESLRALYSTHRVDEKPEVLLQIIWFAVAEVESLHNQQVLALEAAPAEFAEQAACYDNLTRDGKQYRLAVIQSDNPKMKDYVLRSADKGGAGCDILIIKNSRQRVQIFSNGRFRLDRVALEVKRYEDRISGRGQGQARWFYFVPGNGKATGWCSLMNGALTHPDVTATKVKLAELVELVVANL